MAPRSKMWAYIIIIIAISFSHETEASDLNSNERPNPRGLRSHARINPAAAFWAAVFVILGILLLLCWFCQGEQPQEEMELQPQSQEELESQPQSQEMDPPLNDLVEPPATELVEAEQVPNQAASQSFFESFPTTTWQPHSAIGFGATQCRVCLEELVEGDAVRILPTCGHIFHIHCIDSWLSKTTTCPICRYFYS